MLYLDTSFMAPLFKAEQHSSDVISFLGGRASETVIVSRWTCVELSSLLAKDVRIGTLTSAQAVAIDAAFDAFVTSTCTTIDVSGRDFDLSRQFLSNHRSGLRAGDALHLAVASNNAAAGVYSLDRTMVAAGHALGLPMNAGFPATI